MLAETGDVKDFSRPNFAAETKWDGTRLLIIKKDEDVLLQNRHGIDYTRRVPEVTEAAKKISGSFILDGEVVYINPKTGKEEFTPSQRRCATSDFTKIWYLQRKYPVTVMLFDALEINGENIEKEPFRERKTKLKEILSLYRDALEFSDHGVLQFVNYTFRKDEAWKHVLDYELEGLILKDLDSPYVHERSWSWIKVKNWRHQILDVAGFTPGNGRRTGFFGSLVLAKDGRFAGCVGSGFNDWDLRRLKDAFADSPKISKPFDIGQPYVALKTNMKVEIKYYQTTESGVARFPVFTRIVN